MKLTRLFLSVVAGSFLFVSCSNDDDASPNQPSGAYADGLFILNQGGFNAGNASVSFLSDAFILENNIFAGVNPGHILGDTAQDMGLYEDKAYIVLNNSNKIEVVNRYTFRHEATIGTGLVNPRYIAFSGDKAFVTNWGNAADPSDDYVAVIDLSTNAIVANIAVAEGPERIIEEDGKLYVAHYGGYNFGNKISVIDAAGNSIVTTITVGDAPESMAIESGKLYVLTEGIPSWAVDPVETAGRIDVINLSNNTIVNSWQFASATHPSNLVIEDDKLYYTIDSDAYTMSLTDVSLPSTPLFSTTGQGVYGVYSLAVDNGHIFVGDAADYNSAGKIHVYSLSGSLLHSFNAGVIPTGFYFNN